MLLHRHHCHQQRKEALSLHYSRRSCIFLASWHNLLSELISLEILVFEVPTLRVGHAEGVVRLAPEAEEVTGEPGVEEGPEVLLLPCNSRERIWPEIRRAITCEDISQKFSLPSSYHLL